MKKKMSILDFKKYKEEKRKFAYVTAYDYTMTSIVDESDVEIILVGDSLGMTMLGYDSTVPVTVEDMIHHGSDYFSKPYMLYPVRKQCHEGYRNRHSLQYIEHIRL